MCGQSQSFNFGESEERMAGRLLSPTTERAGVFRGDGAEGLCRHLPQVATESPLTLFAAIQNRQEGEGGIQ